MTEKTKKALSPTDSKFSLDQRLMKYQNSDKASDEKYCLEKTQRASPKKNKEEVFISKPLYLDETYNDDITVELIYK